LNPLRPLITSLNPSQVAAVKQFQVAREIGEEDRDEYSLLPELWKQERSSVRIWSNGRGLGAALDLYYRRAP